MYKKVLLVVKLFEEKVLLENFSTGSGFIFEIAKYFYFERHISYYKIDDK